jgi:nuclear autoantigenic sperm protein
MPECEEKKAERVDECTTESQRPSGSASKRKATGGSSTKKAGAKSKTMKEDPRFRRGRALLEAHRYEDATAFFGELLEIKANQYGEMDPRVAPAYLEYGNALFLAAQDEDGTFEDEDQGAEGEGQGSAEGDGEESAEAGDDDQSASGGEVEAGELDDQEVAQQEGAAEGQDAEAAADGEQEEGGEENDLTLSWQMLEVARVLYSKRSNDEFALSRVHLKLGDHSMHRKMYADAIEDYQKALELRKQVLPADDKRIADIHVNLATAFIESGEASADQKGGDETQVKEASEQAAVHTKHASNILHTHTSKVQANKRAKTEGGAAAGSDWTSGAGSTKKGQAELELEDMRATALLVENVKARAITLAGRKRQADGTFR